MSRHLFTNKQQLRHLLVIDEPHKETIYGVVGRMEVLIEYMSTQESLHRLLPFLKTYYFVTKAGAQKYLLYKHFFWSLKDYEMLDVYFATLYFQPLFLYLTERKGVKPWQHYFHYCKKADSTPLLCLLLGINAHINADLYTSLVQLDYRHQKDYFWVNTLLQEVFPQAIAMLVQEKDLLGLVSIAARELVESEFQKIILQWRLNAWKNAQFTLTTRKPAATNTVIEQTELLATRLVADFNHLYHLGQIAASLQDLHSLSIKLV